MVIGNRVKEAVSRGQHVVVRHHPGDNCLPTLICTLGRPRADRQCILAALRKPIDVLLEILGRTICPIDMLPREHLQELLFLIPKLGKKPVVLVSDTGDLGVSELPNGWVSVQWQVDEQSYLTTIQKHQEKLQEELYVAALEKLKQTTARPQRQYTMEVVAPGDKGGEGDDILVTALFAPANTGLRARDRIVLKPVEQISPKAAVPEDEKKAFEKVADLLRVKTDGTSNWDDVIEQGRRHVQNLMIDAHEANHVAARAQAENVHLRMRCCKMGDEYNTTLHEEREVIANLRTTVARLEEEKTNLLKQLRKK